jgi:hypothetical protein
LKEEDVEADLVVVVAEADVAVLVSPWVGDQVVEVVLEVVVVEPVVAVVVVLVVVVVVARALEQVRRRC